MYNRQTVIEVWLQTSLSATTTCAISQRQLDLEHVIHVALLKTSKSKNRELLFNWSRQKVTGAIDTRLKITDFRSNLN